MKEIAWNLFIDYLPKEVISKTDEQNLKIKLVNGSEISLKGTDNPDSLVGVGLHFVVLDEAALMKENIWTQIIRPMLIDTKGQALFISTPRGLNWFYDLWTRALTDDNFERFQFTTLDNTAVEDIASEVRDAEEKADNEAKKATVRQELYASFEVLTGRARFNGDLLKVLFDRAKEPIRTVGLLSEYAEPIESHRYVIGVDTSEGLATGDNCSAIVLDVVDYMVCAELTGQIAPDLLAVEVNKLARRYNMALVVVEDNNHGLLTLNELKKTYSNLYYRKVKDEITDEWTRKVGWRTSSRTKPILIGNLDKALRDGLGIPAKTIIQELMTYVIDDDGGTNASEGSKDDRVMALACAVQGYLESEHVEIKNDPPKKWWEEQLAKPSYHTYRR